MIQYFDDPENSILECGITSTRLHCLHRVISFTPLCTHPRFPTAFDRISHYYLFQILHRYGFKEWFIESLCALHEKSNPLVQLNGILAGPIPIQREWGKVVH